MGKYERIRNLRQDRDLTQKQIADVLFMQLTQYRRYETGERELPLDIAIALSDFYNVPIDYIAGISNKITLSEEGLTTNEKQLLQNYRKLSESDKMKLIKISSKYFIPKNSFPLSPFLNHQSNSDDSSKYFMNDVSFSRPLYSFLK